MVKLSDLSNFVSLWNLLLLLFRNFAWFINMYLKAARYSFPPNIIIGLSKSFSLKIQLVITSNSNIFLNTKIKTSQS